MQSMPTHRPDGSTAVPRSHAAAPLQCADPLLLQHQLRDEQFMDMLNGFRLSGGLARGHEVASVLARRSGPDFGTLARWIVEGAVIHIEWEKETWLPMFQFGGPAMAPRASVSRVLKELQGVFDPWDTAQWFARPCAGLGGRTPADTLETCPDLVLHAARCDRYVVDG